MKIKKMLAVLVGVVVFYILPPVSTIPQIRMRKMIERSLPHKSTKSIVVNKTNTTPIKL